MDILPNIHWCWSNRTCSPPLPPSWFKQYLSGTLFTGFLYSSICWWQRCCRGDTPQWQGHPPHPKYTHTPSPSTSTNPPLVPQQAPYLSHVSQWTTGSHSHRHIHKINTDNLYMLRKMTGQRRKVKERKWWMDWWMFERKENSHYVLSVSSSPVAVTGSWWPKWPGKQGVAYTAVVTVVITHSVINAHNQRCLRTCVCVSPMQGIACLLQPNGELQSDNRELWVISHHASSRTAGGPRASPHQLTLGPG